MEYFVPWSEHTPVLHRGRVISKREAQAFKEVIMPTEEELEERITEAIDRERVKAAILSLEISQMSESLERLNERA